VSTSGKPLNYQSLKRILLRPRIAGLLADGTPGSWEPVLDRETWELVRGVLLSRSLAYADRPLGTPKYLLSGLATCWACKRPVQRQSAGRAGNVALGYGCVTRGCHKVHRNMQLLDGYVGRMVVNRLNDDRNPPGRIPDRPGLAAQFRTLTEARAELAAKVADPDQPHVDLLLQRLDSVDARIGALRETTEGAARARLLATHQGITWDDWLGETLAVRRSLVSATFRVVLLAASRRGPGFYPDDVDMAPL
jgi:site-specific DNA recombinase